MTTKKQANKPSLALVPVKKAALTKEQKLQALALKRAQATVAGYSDWNISQKRERTKDELRRSLELRLRDFLGNPDGHKKGFIQLVNEYQKFMAMSVADLRAQMLREKVEEHTDYLRREETWRVSKAAKRKRSSTAIAKWDERIAVAAQAAKRHRRNPDDPNIA
jgi:hypothetical protein